MVGVAALLVAIGLRCTTGGDIVIAAPDAAPTQAPAAPVPMTLATLGVRIAYARVNQAGIGDLVIQNPDDSTIIVQGAHGAFSGIAWSPDGSHLAVSFGASPGVQNVFVADGDGTNLKHLTTDGRSSQPTWSPDGLTIAYVAGQPGQPGTIATMRADGSGPRQLASAASADNPAWAPDGSSIAVSGPPGTIGLLAPTTGDQTSTVQLLRDSAPSDTSLSWSGDSTAVAAVVLRGSRLALVVLADGFSAQRQVGAAILGNPADPASVHPSFAPDGSKVIAASAETGDILAFDINALPNDAPDSGTLAIQVLVHPPAGNHLLFPATTPVGRRGRTPAIT